MRYFISEQFLKDQGVLSENIDVKKYTPLIQNSARSFIRPLIGMYFFDDLLIKYNDNTLSTDERLVVDIMRYSILWRATAEAGVSVSYQLTNKGYQTQSGDFSASLDNNVVWKLYDHYIQKCLIYDEQLVDFLTKNKEKYPSFISQLNNDNKIIGCDNTGISPGGGINVFFI